MFSKQKDSFHKGERAHAIQQSSNSTCMWEEVGED